MRKHYERMICDSIARAKHSLAIQNNDKSSPFYGGFPEPNGIYQAKYSIYRVASMIAVYSNSDTCLYQNENVYQAILNGMNYIERMQHETGLFDYVTCNFNSAPDTAFCIKKLIPVLVFLRNKKEKTQSEKQIEYQVERIVCRGAFGMLQGGFHTPNHRWAIASVLAVCGKLFEKEELMEAAKQYLNEGIDCNEDGEFSEKSAGNYNRINNDAMMMLAMAFGDSSYETYAIRNLKMMLTYIEPDDSIFTANSTRFDKDHLIFPKDYYYEYLSLGIRYQIPEFLEMANYIFHIVEEKQITSPDFLIHYMNHPEFIDYEVETGKIPTEYRTYYKESGILRARHGAYTYTVMNGKSNFLYFHTKTMKLELKIGGSFCEHRAFIGEEMSDVAEEGKVSLHQTMHGWYYLPFQEKPDTSDWWKMDHQSRPKKMGPDMKIDVTVMEQEHGIDVAIKTEGVEGAPWRVELAFNGIKWIGNEHMIIPVHGDETIVLKDSYVDASNETETLHIGPAFGNHHFIEGKEDSEKKTPGAATIYFTDYTPFSRIISIRTEK